jgi:hypothetical protein
MDPERPRGMIGVVLAAVLACGAALAFVIARRRGVAPVSVAVTDPAYEDQLDDELRELD